MSDKQFQIRDPIYGFIHFNEWEKAVIDHPAFQRLRRIRQLALTDMVYPGATHTRFEHSLGVMHLASLMFDAITENRDNIKLLKQEGYNISKKLLRKDRQIIRFAALLHDIGHAPFSHASDELFQKKDERNGEHYSHEDYTVEIIEKKLKEVIEDKKFNRLGISAEHISSLIMGMPEPDGAKPFWKELISSQLDADRGDYLLRDSHHIGVKYGIYDYPLLLNTITLGRDNDELAIGIEEGGMHVAEAIVLARYQLFTQVYFHKTRKAFDYHLKNAIQQSLSDGKYPTPDLIDEYLEYDDFSIWKEIKSYNSNDFNAIEKREHIREVYYVDKNEDPGEILSLYDTILKDKGIKFSYCDKSEQTWYKLGSKDDNLEIKIVDVETKNIKPLSKRSVIIEHLRSMNQGRIYVNKTDKKKATRIIEKLKKQ